MEVATTTGALVGASPALRVSTGAIAEVFGVVLLYSAAASLWPGADSGGREWRSCCDSLGFDSGYPTANEIASYHVHHVVGWSSLMLGLGMLSGLLGIGSAAFKVIAFERIMRVPFKRLDDDEQLHDQGDRRGERRLYLERRYIDPGPGMPWY